MSNRRYDLAASAEEQLPSAAKLLYVSTAKFGVDWHSISHSHSHAELFYVVGGMGQFQIEDERHPVSPDTLVIVNPNVEHTEMSLNDNPLEYIVLGVDGLELTNADGFENRYRILNFQGSEDVLGCLRNILRETESKQPGYEVICQNFLNILMIRLMRGTSLSTALPSVGQSIHQCAAVRRYIDAHYKEALTLDQLASVAHMNKFHLAHAFKDEYGISPISYLINRRIEESRYLLQETGMTLTQISQVLGFSSPSYFSQSFRRVTNMGPLEYRKSVQKKKGNK